ncbi:hypothetical protein PFISCL1PPCAC_10352, partial [Pristionchus fissidentatus]
DPCISISLSTDDYQLWSQFAVHTTEMIVTKPGRKLFPKLTLSVRGLRPDGIYGIKMTLKRADKYKYRFNLGKWTISNEEEEATGFAPPEIYHLNGFQQRGDEWMRKPIQFHNFKLTNNPLEQEKHMVFVQSLHKYTPVVEIFECNQFMMHTLVKW